MFDQTNTAHLQALYDEVTLDPRGRGYGAAGSTQGIIDLLNEKTETVSKPRISSALIRSTTTYDAYNNLSIDEQEWIRWMTGSNGYEEENVPVTTDLRQQLTGDGGNSIWAASNRTEMEAAMLALIDVPGSWVEVTFGYGSTVSRDDWLRARDYGG